MEPESHPLEDKLKQWRSIGEDVTVAHFTQGVDLTLNPTGVQGTLPFLTPYQVMNTKDVLRTVVSVPSILVTSGVTAILGALFAWLTTTTTLSVATKAPGSLPGNVVRRLLKGLTGLALAVMYWKFMSRRFPTVKSVSQYRNFSTSSRHPCFAADRVLSAINSHAGTHVVHPLHFASGGCRTMSISSAIFSGPACVLDIADEWANTVASSPADSADTRGITVEILSKYLERLPRDVTDGRRVLWRLLLVTKRPDQYFSSTDEYKNAQHAFLYPETVEFLHRRFPCVLLLGIDTPSMDCVNSMLEAMPASEALLRCGITTLLNLDARQIGPLCRAGGKGYTEGSIVAVFNPLLQFDDAAGCSVIFYPPAQVALEQA